MSMYKDYIENQMDNRFVYENQFGFLTYNYKGEICQLEEIYIKPEFRRKGKASFMYKMAEELAKGVGCKHLLGSIVIGTNGSEESMMCLFNNGFKLYKTDGIMIYVIKKVEV